MRTLLSIDPGMCTGWAFFRAGMLERCGVTTVDAPLCPALALIPHCSDLVVEWPQVYRPGQSKGDPNDLIKVAVEVGRWIERADLAGAATSTPTPNEWKGQVPKGVHHARAKGCLTPSELGTLPILPESKAHNMLDAVALGLWRLGRLRR